MKPAIFHGDALERIRDFPPSARSAAGFQLDLVQQGRQPDDYRPMPSIGAGVEEIRIHAAAGAFRIIYIARLRDAVHVLHAFQKKTQTTAPRDIELARTRFRQLTQGKKP